PPVPARAKPGLERRAERHRVAVGARPLARGPDPRPRGGGAAAKLGGLGGRELAASGQVADRGELARLARRRGGGEAGLERPVGPGAKPGRPRPRLGDQLLAVAPPGLGAGGRAREVRGAVELGLEQERELGPEEQLLALRAGERQVVAKARHQPALRAQRASAARWARRAASERAPAGSGSSSWASSLPSASRAWRASASEGLSTCEPAREPGTTVPRLAMSASRRARSSAWRAARSRIARSRSSSSIPGGSPRSISARSRAPALRLAMASPRER